MYAVDQNLIDWLLSDEIPPVKYLTLKNILNKSERSAVVRAAKKEINTYHVIQTVLKNRNKFWGEDRHLYRKYQGAYWQLIFLGDLHADGRAPEVREGCEFILNDGELFKYLDRKEPMLICLCANLLRSLVTLGYGKDERVRHGLVLLADHIVRNKGIPCRVMDESLLTTCYMALPKVLLALSSLPDMNGSIRKAKKIVADMLIQHHIYMYVPGNTPDWQEQMKRLKRRFYERKAQKKTGGPRTIRAMLAPEKKKFIAKHGLGELREKKGWLKFGFPLHYNSDILEAMRSLAAAGVGLDRRLTPVLDIIRNKAMDDGTWRLENSLNGKMWIDIEKKGKPSRWITYHALSVIRHFNGLEVIK